MRSFLEETVRVLGVNIWDTTMDQAIQTLAGEIENFAGRSRSVFFVNAHSLNIATENAAYRRSLQQADYVFGDGTGVRWAARFVHSRRLKDNVNGTDLVPRLLPALAGRGYRYYLLGATDQVITAAAKSAEALFPGWTLAGYHHGYLDAQSEARVVAEINALDCQLLLVGMGNPLQEAFIERNLHRLRVPLCMGTGGLFTYWSGHLERAPLWMRRLGCEWLHLVLAQPHKFRRYAVGNPLFLSRVVRSRRQRDLVEEAMYRDG
jgi:N-acetylglucosaminyldiphosphoundecaprenol N-acetyl-beta-D-mannosaminyltransferase